MIECGNQSLRLSAFCVTRVTQHDLERVLDGADRLVGIKREMDRRMDCEARHRFVRLSCVPGIQAFFWRLFLSLGRHVRDWEWLAGDTAVAQAGAGSLVFSRAPVVMRRPLIHASLLMELAGLRRAGLNPAPMANGKGRGRVPPAP
jgi:hypothetical protein